jgi:hypothetical protein
VVAAFGQGLTELKVAGVFKAHLTSKKHMKAAERKGCGGNQEGQLEQVVWAANTQPRGRDGETHAERLTRLNVVCDQAQMLCVSHAAMHTAGQSVCTAVAETVQKMC